MGLIKKYITFGRQIIATAQLMGGIPGGADKSKLLSVVDPNFLPLRLNESDELMIGGSVGNYTEDRYRGADVGGDFLTAYTSATSITISNLNARIYKNTQIRNVLQIQSNGLMTRLSLTNLVLTENLVKDANTPANIFGITSYVLSSTDWALNNTDTFIVVLAAPRKQRHYTGARMPKTGANYWDGVTVMQGTITSDLLDVRGFTDISLWITAGTLAGAADTTTNQIKLSKKDFAYSSQAAGDVWGSLMHSSSTGSTVTFNDTIWAGGSAGTTDAVIKQLDLSLPLDAPFITLMVTNMARISAAVAPRTIKCEYILFNR